MIPALGLDGLVDAVLASCDAGTVKPDLLVLAMRDLGVTRAEAVLVDDEPAQVAAATRMGLEAILIRRGAAGNPWRRTPLPRLSATWPRSRSMFSVL